jgi:hypothetical protein
MDVRQTMELIAEHFHVDGFGESEEGLKQLVFDDELVVVFNDKARRDGIWLEVEIGSLPDEDREGVLKLILTRNVVAAHKDIPCCALRGDGIILQKFLNVETIMSHQIGETVEAFVNHAETWKKLINRRLFKPYGDKTDVRELFNSLIRP